MKQFVHCTQCELCTMPEILSTNDVSANTTQLAILHDIPRSEKKKTFGTKMELHLKVLRESDLDILRSRLLKAITFALQEEFGTDFISVQIISLEVKNHAEMSNGEADDTTRNRKRRNDELEEFMEVFVVIFIKLFVKIEDEQISGITEKIEKEVMLIDMLKSVKIIPLNKDTIIYFWFQMIILLITIFIFVYSTVKRHKLNAALSTQSSDGQAMIEKEPGNKEIDLADNDTVENGDEPDNNEEVKVNEKSEDALYFFLICFIHFFLPVMDIYPSVYVWYDYETNSSLAFTPRSFKFTILLLGFVMIKLMFFVWNTMVLNQVIADPDFISRNRLVYRLSCRGVSGGVLPYLCIDGIQSVLIYFYFTRFILPGEIISDGAYLCLAFAVIKGRNFKSRNFKSRQ